MRHETDEAKKLKMFQEYQELGSKKTVAVQKEMPKPESLLITNKNLAKLEIQTNNKEDDGFDLKVRNTSELRSKSPTLKGQNLLNHYNSV